MLGPAHSHSRLCARGSGKHTRLRAGGSGSTQRKTPDKDYSVRQGKKVNYGNADGGQGELNRCKR